MRVSNDCCSNFKFLCGFKKAVGSCTVIRFGKQLWAVSSVNMPVFTDFAIPLEKKNDILYTYFQECFMYNILNLSVTSAVLFALPLVVSVIWKKKFKSKVSLRYFFLGTVGFILSRRSPPMPFIDSKITVPVSAEKK